MKRLLFISMIALAGCQAGAGAGAKQGGAVAQNEDDPCAAVKFASLVGTQGSDVNESMFPDGTRVLRPGMVMTMDYRGDRLNVVIGESGKVERVHCG